MLASSQIVLIHSREKRNSYLLILQYDIGYIHWLHRHRLGCSKMYLSIMKCKFSDRCNTSSHICSFVGTKNSIFRNLKFYKWEMNLRLACNGNAMQSNPVKSFPTLIHLSWITTTSLILFSMHHACEPLKCIERSFLVYTSHPHPFSAIMKNIYWFDWWRPDFCFWNCGLVG